MPRHDPRVRARHMLDHAREAVGMVRGRTRVDLDTDRQLNLARVRLMGVVGEAASRVPADFRQQYPGVPWQDIADLRNRLIHGYDEVNLDVLWVIVHEDLPKVIVELESVLQEAD